MTCCCKVPPQFCYYTPQQKPEYKLPCCYRLDITGVTDPQDQCGLCPPGCDVQNRSIMMGWTNPGSNDASYNGSVCPGGGFTCWSSGFSGISANIVGQELRFRGVFQDAHQQVTLNGTFEFEADEFDLRGHGPIVLTPTILQKVASSNTKVCEYSGLQATLTPILLEGLNSSCTDYTICESWNLVPTCPDSVCYQQAPIRAIVTIPNGWVRGPVPPFGGVPGGDECDVHGDFVFDNPCRGSWNNGEPVFIFVPGVGQVRNGDRREITTGFGQTANGVCVFSVQMIWNIDTGGHCQPRFTWNAPIQRPNAAICDKPLKCLCDKIPELALVPQFSPPVGSSQFCRGHSCPWDGQSLRVEFEYA